MRAWAAAVVAVAVACGATRNPLPAPQARHVFVIVMENHSVEQALSGHYTASLAAKYAVANNYHAVSHPSVPNYLALTSGSTWGVQNVLRRRVPLERLAVHITRARPWRLRAPLFLDHA